jgi:hypothetical protein
VSTLVVSKEPSAKIPALTEFDVKRGNAIVDMDGGDHLLPAKAVQSGSAAESSATVAPTAKGGYATGTQAAPATLKGSLVHMAKAAMGGIKGVVDTVTGHAPMAAAGAGGKTTTPMHMGAAGAGSPPSPRDTM